MHQDTVPETVASASPESTHAHASGGSSVNQFRFDLGAPTLIVVILLLLIVAANGVVMGLNLAKQAQQDAEFRDLKTQAWLVERRLMDREALDILHGVKVAGDDQNGPTGNLQRMKPQGER